VVADSRVLAVALWQGLRGRPVHGAFRALPFPVDRDAAPRRAGGRW
jgi:hypothetical protein